MKLLAKGILLAVLLMPAMPMAAHAFEGWGPAPWHPGWGDIVQDRHALHWDLANHRWAAANWQWHDIQADRRWLAWNHAPLPGPYPHWWH